jgi:hypothetical protein
MFQRQKVVDNNMRGYSIDKGHRFMLQPTQLAWIVKLECSKCIRSNEKLILAPRGASFHAGCVMCQRSLSVRAERFFVYAGFLIIRIKEF